MIVGIGVDAVEMDRFRAALRRTPGMRERVFTDEELAYADESSDPVPSLAVRFAAREAVMKAMGVGLGAFGFHDVFIRRESTGRPSLVVEGVAARLANERGIEHWHVSLSHTDGTAIAFVVAAD